MGSLQIVGGERLHGSLRIQGAKNAALPILAATLLCGDRCEIENCPDIRDVHSLLELLRQLGCRAELRDGVAAVDTAGLCNTRPDAALAGRLRASVLLLGALLGASGEAHIPLPGGCALGARPLDLHLRTLEALGVRLRCDGEGIHGCGRPEGGAAFLRYPSVGATENLLLAACAAKAPVTILGAAKEPEIADLAAFLCACGARIQGAGGAVLRVEPAPLHGCRYRVMPDRMAAATWLCALAACGGEAELHALRPAELDAVCRVLRGAGCRLESDGDRIRICASTLRAPAPIVTGPYPAFPTDAQAPVMAALLRAEGTTVFYETVFEDRYRHVPALRRLGAQIELAGRAAGVRGVPALHGAELTATDLRGGAAMLIAALSAEGESILHGTEHLQRGYEALLPSLSSLGAHITEAREPDAR